MTEKDPYHHGDLRNALLAAAREILDEAGVSGLSLRAVARRAGVSQTAPYRHFKDKAALIAAIATDGFLVLKDTLEAASDEGQEGEGLHSLGRAYVNFARKNTGLYRLMFGPEIGQVDRDDAIGTPVAGPMICWLGDCRRTGGTRQVTDGRRRWRPGRWSMGWQC